MRISSNTRRAMLGMVLAAAATGSIVQAQGNAADRPLPVPHPGGPQGDIVIKCCKCLGQESGAVNISTGTAPWRVSSVLTPAWPVAALTGPSNPSPLIMPGNIGPNPLPGTWTNSLAPAVWLQPGPVTGGTYTSFPNGHVTYKLKIRVPNCSIKQKVVINGRLAADDKGLVFVDGPGGGAVPLSPSSPPYAGFPTASIRNFSYQLGGSSPFTAPGTYTIRVEVDNLGGGPFGMVLNGMAQGRCDDKLEVGNTTRADPRESRNSDAVSAEACKDC